MGGKTVIVWRYVNIVLFVVNIALFGLWWSMIKVDAAPAADVSNYVFSHVGLLITALGVLIGVAALVLAALGFIGFQTVLERAEAMADKTAKEVVARLANDGVLDKSEKPRQIRDLPDVGATEEAKD